MRPIKFRGKRLNDGKWEYGHYCVVQSKHFIIPDDAEMYVSEPPCHFVDVIGGGVEVDPETVG